MPQPAQFIASALVFTSQPLANSLSQSAKPALHDDTAHLPALHPGRPLAAGPHGIRQPPQLATSLPRSASHPSAGFTLQSAKPASQASMTQLPPAQAGLAWATA